MRIFSSHLSFCIAFATSTLLLTVLTQRGSTQPLPPASQIGSIAGQEFCEVAANISLVGQETVAEEFDQVVEQGYLRFSDRMTTLYGQDISSRIDGLLTNAFTSPAPPEDPYFAEILQNWIRFVTIDNVCYDNAYELFRWAVLDDIGPEPAPVAPIAPPDKDQQN